MEHKVAARHLRSRTISWQLELIETMQYSTHNTRDMSFFYKSVWIFLPGNYIFNARIAALGPLLQVNSRSFEIEFAYQASRIHYVCMDLNPILTQKFWSVGRSMESLWLPWACIRACWVYSPWSGWCKTLNHRNTSLQWESRMFHSLLHGFSSDTLLYHNRTLRPIPWLHLHTTL